MLTRPNDSYEMSSGRGIGNLIERRFHNLLQLITSHTYNDGTPYSRILYKLDDEKRSAFYIRQMEIESELQLFNDSMRDELRFLVGYTGIGKTTLLRNTYGVMGRAPIITEKKLIVYLSFYSQHSNGGIEEIIVRNIKLVIRMLENHLGKSNIEYYDEVFDFIKATKPELLQGGDFVVDEKAITKKETLRQTEGMFKREFLLSVVKYLLSKSEIENVTMIYDDLEAISSGHEEAIITFLDINNCLATSLKRSYSVKTLVSLRSYTFRYAAQHTASVHRIRDDHIILKKTIPDIAEILNRRIEVLSADNDFMATINNREAWMHAASELKAVINKTGEVFGKILAELANYNIATMLLMLERIITNKKWFSPKETDEAGAFVLNAYDYESSNKANILKALVYGKDNVYTGEGLLPNILQFHAEENSKVEFLYYYILKYYRRANKKDREVRYGATNVKVHVMVDDFKELFGLYESEKKFEELMIYAINYLYRKGLLKHSIFEHEKVNGEKQVRMEYGLYISVRAIRILEQLENDSFFLEFYRDDIDTELKDNRVISNDLSVADRLEYIVSYIDHLFSNIEVKMIQKARCNLEKYIRHFGSTLLISELLLGVLNTVKAYFRGIDDLSEKERVLDCIKTLVCNVEAKLSEFNFDSSQVIVLDPRVVNHPELRPSSK